MDVSAEVILGAAGCTWDTRSPVRDSDFVAEVGNGETIPQLPSEWYASLVPIPEASGNLTSPSASEGEGKRDRI